MLEVVTDLEMRMDIAVRWTPGSGKWLATEALLERRNYQKALDRLESLVVARMFELTKMNMSQTGEFYILLFSELSNLCCRL